ncbi:MAG: ribosomal protein S18-alanine N-acetyltransferase [Candidatus Hydrogenedentes bacterium]|nr:ribosomal protein S18-alanine N-acetyltransferase [Candidatus Hydrogenedentota bacterium]
MSVSEESRLHFLPLRPDHIPHLIEMEHEAYPDPWKHGMFRQEITNATSFFRVVYCDDVLVAYGGFWLMVDEAHITKVTVDRRYRGQGIGHELMMYLLEEAVTRGAHTARLEVRENNYAARRLYERLGFHSVGLRKGYYAKTNETAIVMARTLRDF